MSDPANRFFLFSERLKFRRWEDSDQTFAQELWGDPEVTKLIDARGPLSKEMVAARLHQEIERERVDGVQYWPMFLRTSDIFVGCCGLRPYDAEKGIFELGFHICRRFWSGGIATESGSAVIGHAFGTLGAKGLFAGHHPENSASRAVMKKLGFLPIGEQYYEPTGLMHSAYLLMKMEKNGRSET